MSDLFWLSDRRFALICPSLLLAHGIPRSDDCKVVSGIIRVIRSGLRLRNAPREYGPHKTLYNRIVRWSRPGIFDRIFSDLAAKVGEPDDGHGLAQSMKNTQQVNTRVIAVRGAVHEFLVDGALPPASRQAIEALDPAATNSVSKCRENAALRRAVIHEFGMPLNANQKAILRPFII